MFPVLAEIPYPQIDPVAFRVFSFAVRWYGISYVVAFLIAHLLLRRLSRERIFPGTPADAGDMLFHAIIGVIVGGRLGYALFYKPGHYLKDPLDLIRIWEGGLSFHGGLIGVVTAITLFAKRRRLPLARVADACALAAPPGIFCVRIANFVNHELWGRPTSVPWAMVFPDAGGVPRHPSQIYEALLEGALLFAVLWLLRKRAAFAVPGRLAAVFLCGYGALRFLAEFTREPDRFLGTVAGPFSMGQVLCAVMLAAGLIVLWRTSPRARAGTTPGP